MSQLNRYKWIRRVKTHPFVALMAGLIVGTLLSSLSLTADASPTPNPAPSRAPTDGFQDGADQEPSPEDVAREFGLPVDDGDEFGSQFGAAGFSKNIPATRVVPRENFKDFRVNVDIFRKSTKRPVLGEFRDEYIDILAPASDGGSDDERRTAAERAFKILAGKEFSLLSIDGVPTKAYIISGAIEANVNVTATDKNGKAIRDPETHRIVTRKSMKSTPPGNYRLDPLVKERSVTNGNGFYKTADLAYPWIRSSKYGNSQMFWGLWIKGGYFIHSTPHYGELGRPASMGCIRQSFPDAMDLFKLLVEENMSGMIRIQRMGSKAAVSRLREAIVDSEYEAPADAPLYESPKDPAKDMSWVVAQLRESAAKIDQTKKYYGSEIEILGHAWIDEVTAKPASTVWPSCGAIDQSPIDCFVPFKVRKPKNSAN